MTKASETKEKLINAALKLISQKGYLGTTTREIARTAGVTELTLFRRFGSKQRLFEELLARHMFLPALRELLPGLGSLSYEEALRTVATRVPAEPQGAKAHGQDHPLRDQPLPGKNQEGLSPVHRRDHSRPRALFPGPPEKGPAQGFAPELAARAFMGMLFSYFRTEEIMKGAAITKKDDGAGRGPVRGYFHSRDAQEWKLTPIIRRDLWGKPCTGDILSNLLLALFISAFVVAPVRLVAEEALPAGRNATAPDGVKGRTAPAVSR